MNFVVDSHTHTIASGHAYSTLEEMIREASNKGIKVLVISDHGSNMDGSPCLYYFSNLRVIPKKIHDVRIIKSCEANIINYIGELDIPLKYLKKLEFVIAGFHDVCINPSNIEEHTNAFINILKNPYVDVISHPGNPKFKVDIEKVVIAVKEQNKLIEINNHSFSVRHGSEENCKEFVRLCKKFEVRIICGSDAHISFDVGKFDKVYELLKEIDMPEELIINTSLEKFENYLLERQNRLIKLKEM